MAHLLPLLVERPLYARYHLIDTMILWPHQGQESQLGVDYHLDHPMTNQYGVDCHKQDKHPHLMKEGHILCTRK